MAATLCQRCGVHVTPIADGPDLMCPRCKLVLPAPRIGRPPKDPADRIVTPVVTFRLSPEHQAELKARGGVQGLRDWLDGPRPASKRTRTRA